MSCDAARHVGGNPLVLRMIFSHLSPRDVQTVSLVSRVWRETSDDPLLWSWAVMRASGRNLSDVLNSSRIQAVRGLLYDGGGEDARTVSDNLRTISNKLMDNSLSLKYLNIDTYLEDSSENSIWLARIVCQVEQVELHDMKLSSDLITFKEVFADIGRKENLKLRSLNVSGSCITAVDAETFAQAVNRVEEMKMCRTRMLPAQLQAMLIEFLAGGSTLKSLDLSRALNIPIEMSLLSQTVCNLVEVKLWGTDPVIDINLLLSKILETEHLNLRKLDIGGSDLCRVCPRTLSEVACQLEGVGLSRANLPEAHLSELFSKMSGSDPLKVKDLDVGGNNLSVAVSPHTLANVVTRTRNVDLWRTHLTEEQIHILFQNIVTAKNLELRKLNISQNNLSSLSPAEFSEALNRLEEVSLYKCKIVNTSNSYGSYSLPHHDCYFHQICENPGKLRVLRGNFSLSQQIIGRLNKKLQKFSHSFF